jgi:hypothetical protein
MSDDHIRPDLDWHADAALNRVRAGRLLWLSHGYDIHLCVHESSLAVGNTPCYGLDRVVDGDIAGFPAQSSGCR